MSDLQFEHKYLHYAKDLWPFVTGFLVVIFAAFKLMWYRLTSNYVTKAELKACREDVRAVDDKNLNTVFKEIRIMRSENESRHHEIMNQIINVLGKK